MDDGDLSMALYSANTLLVARYFDDGLMETPPLHWEWSGGTLLSSTQRNATKIIVQTL